MYKRLLKFALFAGLFIPVTGASAYFTLTWIVRGEESVVVPDLRERELVSVLEMLTELGLNAKVRELEYDPVVPKSQVIFQDPGPGEEIKKGRDVRIVISRGPRTVFMPNLTDRSAREVDITLEENGLCRGNLSETYSEAHEKGLVIAQEPLPGTIISRNACVNLLVSLGRRPKAWFMPSLEGMALSDAIEKIEAMALRMGEVTWEAMAGRPRNAVLRHTPHPGYRVEEGARVDLVVNRRAGPASEEDPQAAETVLFRHRTGFGFLNRHIRAELRGFGDPLVFFDDYVKPNRELWFIVPKYSGASVQIYENGQPVAGPASKDG